MNTRGPASCYADYHTHTSRCGHAVGEAAEYVAAALGLGLSGIGLSDHMPLEGHPDPGVSMTPADLGAYVAEVLELKHRLPGFVLLGIEADYLPGRVADIRAVLESHPFDYVIGSIHYLDGWGFDSAENLEGFSRRDIDDIYLQYLDLLGEAAETGLYTIIGHLDLVKKFGHRPTRDLGHAYDALCARLARAKVIVELNTAGLRKPVGEIYPHLDLLRRARRWGIPITFGSDAHAPAEVGWEFEAAASLAQAAGYTSWLRLVEQAGMRAKREAKPL